LIKLTNGQAVMRYSRRHLMASMAYAHVRVSQWP